MLRPLRRATEDDRLPPQGTLFLLPLRRQCEGVVYYLLSHVSGIANFEKEATEPDICRYLRTP
eukprot:6293416-Amphidinium_carterae.1